MYPLPESLFSCLSSFGQLDANTEEAYIENMSCKDVIIYDGNGVKLKSLRVSRDISQLSARCVAQVHRTLREELNASVSLRDAVRFFKIWRYLRWEYEHREETRKEQWERANFGSPTFQYAKGNRQNQQCQSHHDNDSDSPKNKKEIKDKDIR